MRMMITNLNHITLAVTDIDRSFSFYYNVLGLKPLVKWDKGAYFLIANSPNETCFCLNTDINRTSSSCYTHYAFSVTTDNFYAMSKRIIESGEKVFKENTLPEDSLYFEDPDGHKLEIHVDNWQSRIAAKKATVGSWKNVEWFV